MKLADHVQKIKNLTYKSFDKQFAQLGVGNGKMIPVEQLPDDIKQKRQKIEAIICNHTDETGSFEKARIKTLEELTFTLFNRVAAIKVMEANLLFPEVITRRPENGGRSFAHKAWLEQNPEMRDEEYEGLRQFLKTALMNSVRNIVLYNRNYPYALLPDTIELNGIIEEFNKVEKDQDIRTDIWSDDDILGWLYESYNNDKKKEHKDSGDKTEYDKVSLQSQVYTPRWVVQFLVDNSLGKLYLEMYPDSEIKSRYKIANAPLKRMRDIKPLHEIKLIDPVGGSGNFILYAFDLFYDLYIDQIAQYGADYSIDDIPRLILENNLHAIDLDDRAIQLAQLGLYIKARKKNRNAAIPRFQVVSTDFYLPEYEKVSAYFEEGHFLDIEQKNIIRELWDDLRMAYKFGSLIRLEEKLSIRLHGLLEKWSSMQIRMFDEQSLASYEQFRDNFFKGLRNAVTQYGEERGKSFLNAKTLDALRFLEIISQKYDVAVANPPYTIRADYGPELKRYIDDTYIKPYKFNSNLYVTFIKRCYELIDEEGKMALIHPMTFMYIKTFADVRRFILDKLQINVFVEYGLSNLFGTVMVDPAFYVFEKINTIENAWFISLDQYTRTPNEKYKKKYCLEALDDYVAGRFNRHNHVLPQDKLKIIDGWPFIYWISDGFREKFKASKLEDEMKVCTGLSTANNNRFLRFWWEIKRDEIGTNWKILSKGGPYNKWWGNYWLTVNWKNNGKEIRNYIATGRAIRNEQFYFQEGITNSLISVKGISNRLLPENMIFDITAPSIFPKNFNNVYYALGYLNTKVVQYIADCLNPTAALTWGDLQKIPFVKPPSDIEDLVSTIASKNVDIKRKLSTYRITELGYDKNPLMVYLDSSLFDRLLKYLNDENSEMTKILLYEAIIDKLILQVYNLSIHDREQVEAETGKPIGDLPVLNVSRQKYLDTANIEDSVLAKHIDNLTEANYEAQKIEEIKNKLTTLYQKNNDLEEFCIRYQVNPINVWYWFQECRVVPKGRVGEISLEFIADVCRNVLMKDEDGIISLDNLPGKTRLLDKLEQYCIGKGFTPNQFSQLDDLVGRPLDDYFKNHFFKDLSNHLNLFMYLPKTPFIWHLKSGTASGFEVYILIYKWSKDKLYKLKSIYLEQRERVLRNRQTDIANNTSPQALSELDIIHRQLAEIDEFKQKIDELLTEGYDPKLDDGVGKNIAPLQQKGMLAYDVLNEKQLKKYLNADW
jgi:hypothetical protein